MKILKKDLRLGIIKIQVTNEEDLWYLSHILEQNDLVSGSTERKIKIGQEPNIKTVRKKVHLEIRAEKVEYEPENKSLRILGVITFGPEDVSLGSHHSFNLELRDEIQITKKWMSFQIEKLEEATKDSSDFLIVVFDRETAKIGELKKTGYKEIVEIKGDVSKKGIDNQSNTFYKDLSKIILEYSEKYQKIILASPAFWKEYLIKELKEEVTKKVIQTTVNSVDDTSIKELLKRDDLKKVLENHRASKEEFLMENIMKNISLDMACYGFLDCKEKISLGNVSEILVSENYLKEMKEENKYFEIDSLLKSAEDINCKIHILTDKEAMKKLDSLGGVAGVLRWKT
jgi:protein pelota